MFLTVIDNWWIMNLYLYVAVSTHFLCSIQPSDQTLIYDEARSVTSILVKLFSRELNEHENAATMPGNSGDLGIATIVISKEKVQVLKNQSKEAYPETEAIAKIAEQHLQPLIQNGAINGAHVSGFTSAVRELPNVRIKS